MIARKIWEGQTAKELGLADSNYASRKETLDRFLAVNGPPVEFEKEYAAWLAEDHSGNVLFDPNDSGARTCCTQQEVQDAEPPAVSTMFADLAKSLAAIAKSGVKMVDEAEHARRYLLCKDCQWFKAYRCMKCGCYMKLKSKFAAMSCPINLW